MNLSELKDLMGIASGDTSNDAILSLYLESAIAAAKKYTNGFAWSDTLPGPIKLGILRYVELSQMRKTNAGVASQSMAGMSQTFKDGDAGGTNYFAEAFDMWEPYRSKGLVFRTAKRRKS
jgi:hypothetical protein